MAQPAAAEGYDYPIIDLNGPAPGTDYANTYVEGGESVPIGEVDNLSIHSSTGMLQSVSISSRNGPVNIGAIDTTGTNIHVTPSPYQLSGLDTVENYVSLLKQLRVTLTNQDGGTLPITLVAKDANGVEGPSSYDLMTAKPAPPTIDIGGTLPDGALSAVPSGRSRGADRRRDAPFDQRARRDDPLLRANSDISLLRLRYGASRHARNEHSGHATAHGLLLSGVATVADYEMVLRTATYTGSLTDVGNKVPIYISVSTDQETGPPTTSYVTVLYPAPPAVDLNGDATGDGYATEYYAGSPAISIVDSEHLSVDFTSSQMIEAARYGSTAAAANCTWHTSGTNITANYQVNTVSLTGADTVENYQQVLRTVTLSDLMGTLGGVHACSR